MNAETFPRPARRAASPYARRLAREKQVALNEISGTGPNGRIVAADILAHQVPAPTIPPQQPQVPTRASILTFSAGVSLTALTSLQAEVARLGLAITLEDTAARAAAAALAIISGDAAQGITIEAGERQIVASTTPGLSISAQHRLRLAAAASDADASQDPAAASLLVLRPSRVVPLALSPLPGRRLRLVLAPDPSGDHAQALLCADADATTAEKAAATLEAFVGNLEQPLALLA